MTVINQLTNAGALPALEMTMRFAAQRQRLTAHNIANIETPNFIQKDVSVSGFQNMLDEAVRERRGRTGGMHGPLAWEETGEIRSAEAGRMTIVPGSSSGTGVLTHDRNNRDLERLMQTLAESTGAFRTAADLYRSQSMILQMAISERV
ncbi:MAG: flagellar basal body rod protein FlgB [Phycisphaerales bacterium JB041]